MAETEYTNLLAGICAGQPKLKAWLAALTDPLIEAREKLANLPTVSFDLDHAQGVFLDAIGVRVGFSRRVPVMLTDLYFAFDDEDGIGFDLGVWIRPEDDLDGFTVLDDEIYRACLKVKIMLNMFTGENVMTRPVLDAVFQAFGVAPADWKMHDNQNMSITLTMRTAKIPRVLRELITRRIISLTPAGVTLIIAEMT